MAEGGRRPQRPPRGRGRGVAGLRTVVGAVGPLSRAGAGRAGPARAVRAGLPLAPETAPAGRSARTRARHWPVDMERSARRRRPSSYSHPPGGDFGGPQYRPAHCPTDGRRGGTAGGPGIPRHRRRLGPPSGRPRSPRRSRPSRYTSSVRQRCTGTRRPLQGTAVSSPPSCSASATTPITTPGSRPTRPEPTSPTNYRSLTRVGPQRTRAAQRGAVSPAGCRSVPGDRQWIRPHLRVRTIARLRVHSVTGSHLKEKPFAPPAPDLVGIVDERSA